MRAIFLVAALGAFGCARPNYEMTANPPLKIEAPEGKGAIVTLDCAAPVAGSHLCVSLRFTAQQTKTTFGAFVFKFWRPNTFDQSAVLEDPPGAALKVLLWMPSMGHGASPIKVTRLDTGTYLAENVFFTMRGDWEIRFQLASNPQHTFKDAAIVPMVY